MGLRHSVVIALTACGTDRFYPALISSIERGE
jgi:hypothetical protein